jgi:hypothetical protein
VAFWESPVLESATVVISLGCVPKGIVIDLEPREDPIDVTTGREICEESRSMRVLIVPSETRELYETWSAFRISMNQEELLLDLLAEVEYLLPGNWQYHAWDHCLQL